MDRTIFEDSFWEIVNLDEEGCTRDTRLLIGILNLVSVVLRLGLFQLDYGLSPPYVGSSNIIGLFSCRHPPCKGELCS